jgi:hypothetical protein
MLLQFRNNAGAVLLVIYYTPTPKIKILSFFHDLFVNNQW